MKFTNIDTNFSIFKKNKCIIWGTGKESVSCTEILNENDIIINAYCDNNSEMWNKKFKNKPVMSPNDFKEYCKKESVTLLIASFYFSEIAEQVSSGFQIENIISSSELHLVNLWKHWKEIICLNSKLKDLYINHMVEKHIHDWYDRVFVDLYIENHMCLPDYKYLYLVHAAPKTGNNTIRNAISNTMHITPFNFCHGFGLVEPDWIDYIKKYPLKIISGLRDPISQLLSLVYEMAACYWDLPYTQDENAAVHVMEDIFLPYALGTEPIDCFCSRLINRKKESPFLLDFFDEQFKEFLDIDVFEYPFDKEQGYTIIKNGNIEIFIYQLEKLDSLEPVLQKFLDNESFSLNVSEKEINSAEEKYYSNYYKNFLSNYHLNSDIIEKIYARRETKHFYSEKDIAKMKSRWF